MADAGSIFGSAHAEEDGGDDVPEQPEEEEPAAADAPPGVPDNAQLVRSILARLKKMNGHLHAARDEMNRLAALLEVANIKDDDLSDVEDDRDTASIAGSRSSLPSVPSKPSVNPAPSPPPPAPSAPAPAPAPSSGSAPHSPALSWMAGSSSDTVPDMNSPTILVYDLTPRTNTVVLMARGGPTESWSHFLTDPLGEHANAWAKDAREKLDAHPYKRAIVPLTPFVYMRHAYMQKQKVKLSVVGQYARTFSVFPSYDPYKSIFGKLSEFFDPQKVDEMRANGTRKHEPSKHVPVSFDRVCQALPFWISDRKDVGFWFFPLQCMGLAYDSAETRVFSADAIRAGLSYEIKAFAPPEQSNTFHLVRFPLDPAKW